MSRADIAGRIRLLTPRQREAVALTWHGYTNAEIGAAMGCSTETARNHLEGAYARLGLRHYADDAPYDDCPRVRAAVALYLALEHAKGDAA